MNVAVSKNKVDVMRIGYRGANLFVKSISSAACQLHAFRVFAYSLLRLLGVGLATAHKDDSALSVNFVFRGLVPQFVFLAFAKLVLPRCVPWVPN